MADHDARSPLASYHPNSDLGELVRIDERNSDEALKLLHAAYWALGKGYWDDREQHPYGRTYEAIADFLYPDVIDTEGTQRALDA